MSKRYSFSNSSKYVNQYSYGPPIEVPEDAIMDLDDDGYDDTSSVLGTAAPYSTGTDFAGRAPRPKSPGASTVRSKSRSHSQDYGYKYTAQNADRLVSEFRKHAADKKYDNTSLNQLNQPSVIENSNNINNNNNSNKPQGERVDFVQPAISDAHNTRTRSKGSTSPVRKLSSFSIGRRKKEELDLIGRLTSVSSSTPNSPSLNSNSNTEFDSDPETDRVNLPKPEDYGGRRSVPPASIRGRRRASSRDPYDSGGLDDESSSNKVLGGFMKLFTSSSKRSRSASSHRFSSSRLRDYRDLGSQPPPPTDSSSSPSDGDPGANLVDIVQNLWISLISIVEPLNFLLVPINSTAEGSTSRSVVVFLEIFITMWVMYYVLILLEAVFTVVKAICSPVVYIAGIFTGRR